MSEFHVEVVQIDKFEKHPDADTLSIFHAFGGYPVIFRTGTYKVGDKAVYVPIDSLVPLDNPLFSFLSDQSRKTEHRIKAKKLRGIFSMGLLIPADPSWQIGENVQEKLNIHKYEPKILYNNSESVSDPGIIPIYTDLEGIRKYRDVLIEGEEVVITEKIHGSNARYVYSQGQLWVGSHKQFKARGNNIWWKVAEQLSLESNLAYYPDFAIYGEVYGGQVQDLRYGLGLNEIAFAAFDVFDCCAGRYLSPSKAFHFCFEVLNIPFVPIVYRGPWETSLWELAEHQSQIDPEQISEGIVIKPQTERWNPTIGRVALKLVGKNYLLRKG